MHHPEDPCVADDNDDARDYKGDDKESGFTTAAVRVLQDGARPQFIVVPEDAWTERRLL